MLERIRFQEIDRAIFKAPFDMCINKKKYKKGEPVLIIDKPTISQFTANSIVKSAIGRSYSGSTNVIDSVTFDIVDGYLLYNLWAAIFTDLSYNQTETVTKNYSAVLDNESNIILPNIINDCYIYVVNGTENTLLSEDNYSINSNNIIFNTPITGAMNIFYTTDIIVKESSLIKDIGHNLVLGLEISGKALDPITGEKLSIVMQFDNVNISTDLSISFNNSETVAFSIISCTALPQKANNGIDKNIFKLMVL